MMTKEECLKALQGYKDLFELHQIDYYVPEKRRKKFLNNFKCIENLIDEHFDNPPLKFEELKKGMWVWDNKCKVFNKISRTFDFYGTNVIDFAYINDTTQFGRSIKFEENRFFPVTKAMQYQNNR